MSVNFPQISRLPRPEISGSIKNEDFQHHHFRDTNALNAQFENCNFSYAVFDRAYFRKATFSKCNFTGCKFIDSNFLSTKFYICDFRYAHFDGCLLELDEIIVNLPGEHNLRRDLLQNMRANAAATGDWAHQRQITLLEISAFEGHYRDAVTGRTSYYQKHYAGCLPKIQAAWSFLFMKLNGFFWGHGERPWCLLFSCICCLFILAVFNSLFLDSHTHQEPFRSLLYSASLYNVRLFLGLTVDQNYSGYPWTEIVIGIMRYLYAGLYVSVLFKSIVYR